MAYQCKNFNGLAISEDDKTYKVAQIGCGQWSCEYCAQKLTSMWRARIINAINELGGLWTWFTITAHSKTRGGYASITNLRNAWEKLVKRMKRKFGKFAYVRVFEQHKDGSFHIHAIASFHFGDIKTRVSKAGTKNETKTTYSSWLASTAKELKIGLYTHADDIDDTKHAGYVSSYVTKYMTKMSGDFIKFIGRVRRIQASQNLPKLPKKGKWEFRRDLTLGVAIEIKKSGKEIIDVSTGEIIDAKYWSDDTYLYPPSANSDFLEYLNKVDKNLE